MHNANNSSILTNTAPAQAIISEMIKMVLSDYVSIDQIRTRHRLGPDWIKVLTRQNSKLGRYRAWRKHGREFSARREVYK